MGFVLILPQYYRQIAALANPCPSWELSAIVIEFRIVIWERVKNSLGNMDLWTVAIKKLNTVDMA